MSWVSFEYFVVYVTEFVKYPSGFTLWVVFDPSSPLQRDMCPLFTSSSKVQFLLLFLVRSDPQPPPPLCSRCFPYSILCSQPNLVMFSRSEQLFVTPFSTSSSPPTPSRFVEERDLFTNPKIILEYPSVTLQNFLPHTNTHTYACTISDLYCHFKRKF